MLSKTSEPIGAWMRLRKGAFDDSGLSIHTIASKTSTPLGFIRYSLGHSVEARVLLPIGMHEKLSPLAESTTLEITDVTYQQKGKPVRFISVSCKITELENVFSEVTEELVTRISIGNSCVEALTTTLNDFRALLLGLPQGQVSNAEIIGLAGELIVLHKLLELNPMAADAWQGPLGERHDFRRNKQAIEVKTTCRAANLEARISAIDQLEEPLGGTLHLAQVALEISASAPLTISSLMKDNIALASRPETVRNLAAGLGCVDVESESWNRLSFSLENITLYVVNDLFPKITSRSFKGSSVPTGVQSVEYVIDLGSAADCVVPDSDLEDVYRGVSG